MLFGAIKPLVLVVGMVAALTGGVSIAHHMTTSFDAAGRPLDWAGDGIKCPKCQASLSWQWRHRYRCRGCEANIEARCDSTTREITFREHGKPLIQP
jgi:hypothetical protein